MSERKMSAKGFLHKTTTKAAISAGAFIAQYREYLITGELAPVATSILLKLDSGLILPTPALKEIAVATMNHIIMSEKVKAEKVIQAAETVVEVKTVVQKKNWLAQILDARGNVCTRVNPQGEVEELVKDFDQAQDADRWCDRRLFDGAPGWYAEITHLTAKVVTIITRDDAIPRVLKQPKGPVIHQKGVSTKSLGFGVKCKETRVSFSRG